MYAINGNEVVRVRNIFTGTRRPYAQPTTDEFMLYLRMPRFINSGSSMFFVISDESLARERYEEEPDKWQCYVRQDQITYATLASRLCFTSHTRVFSTPNVLRPAKWPV